MLIFVIGVLLWVWAVVFVGSVSGVYMQGWIGWECGIEERMRVWEGWGMCGVRLVCSCGWGCGYGYVGVCFEYRGVGLGSVCRVEVGR